MITSENLTIVSVVANNSTTRFVDLMLESVRNFTDGRPMIILADNGSNGKSLDHLKSRKDIDIIKGGMRKKANKTSLAHGTGLNKALSKVKTKYTAIVETDCVVLSHDWYKFDIDKYDVMAAYKAESRGLHTHYVCFMVFLSDLLNGLDWRPLYDGSRDGKYNDCGWEMEEVLSLNPDRVYNLQSVGHKKAKIFTGPSFQYKTQEIYDPDGLVRAAHFFRGSDIARRKVCNEKAAKKQVQLFKKIATKYMEGNKRG
jgi:hypothetical protein